MKNKWVIVCVLIIASLVTWQISCVAAASKKPEISRYACTVFITIYE